MSKNHFGGKECLLSNHGKSLFIEADMVSVDEGGLPIGAGMSPGDCGISEKFSAPLMPFVEVNPHKGYALCSSGLTFKDLLKETIKHKLVPVVAPSSSNITIGGAIAANIHGKSQVRDGCFCNHVESITLRLKNGKEVLASRFENESVFKATCGGLGTTGKILGAKIRLKRVANTGITIGKISTTNLLSTLKILDQEDDALAWIDTSVSDPDKIGRSTLYVSKEDFVDVPLSFKSAKYPLGNKLTLLDNLGGYLLSKAKYYSDRKLRSMLLTAQPIDKYLFHMDALSDWGKAYGPNGYYSFEGLFPEKFAQDTIFSALRAIGVMRVNPFMVTLQKAKYCSTGNLTFSGSGYILSLDLPANHLSVEIIKWLNEYVMNAGGKVYPAKDLFLTEEQFVEMYGKGNINQRISLSHLGGAIGSKQTKRYGLAD